MCAASDVSRAPENGKDVLMELEPDSMNRIDGGAANVIPLAAVDAGDAVGEAADVGLVTRDDRNDFTYRPDQAFGDLQDLRLGLRVAVAFLSVVEALDELIIQGLELVVPGGHGAVFAQPSIESRVGSMHFRRALGQHEIPALGVHRPALVH